MMGDPTFLDLQKHFDSWLQPFWQTAMPSLNFGVWEQGECIGHYEGGTPYRYYDLASLTKVLFTVPAMMLAYSRGQWNPNTHVKDVLGWWPHSQTKIIDILTHSSGLVWWKPFYEGLVKEPNIEKRWELLRLEIESSELSLSEKAVYSDVGFLSLAFLLRAFWNNNLEVVWKDVKTHFAPNSQLHWITQGHRPFPLNEYAPTEHCLWRGYRVQGEVHDENAWALGGVSSHAGLFGRVDDVASVFLTFRSAFFSVNHPLHSVVRLFMQRHLPVEKGDWGLGFVIPTKGKSTSGSYFSPNSVGHTGFTGTSAWWDPDRDLLIVILSNRVYYGREKGEFAKLRPLLHDEIVSFLRSK